MQVLEGDPGRNWRRLARWGALACFLATVLPFDDSGMPLWGAVGEIIRVWTKPRNSYESWLLTAFCGMSVPVFLGGPTFLMFCNKNSAKAKSFQPLNGFFPEMLWAATALTPYLAAFNNLPERSRSRETMIAIAISLLSAYLFICGLCFLASRRARNTPIYIFCIGTLPIGVMLVAWSTFAVFLVREIAAGGWTGKVAGWPTLEIAIGFFGSLALLIGWLNWWGAVKKACAPKPVIEAAPQLAGAADASTGR